MPLERIKNALLRLRRELWLTITVRLLLAMVRVEGPCNGSSKASNR